MLLEYTRLVVPLAHRGFWLKTEGRLNLSIKQKEFAMSKKKSGSVFLKIAVCPPEPTIPASPSVKIAFLYGSGGPKYVEVGDWFQKRLGHPLEHRDHLKIRDHAPEGLVIHLEDDGTWSVDPGYLEAWLEHSLPHQEVACGQ